MTLDAAIGQVFIPYCPGGHHGHQFRRKKLSCGVVKLLFKSSIQKARNRPSTQLIEATSCVERWNTTTLRMDKNNRSYQSSKKFVEKWALMSAYSHSW
jgi:hypothetical protein